MPRCRKRSRSSAAGTGMLPPGTTSLLIDDDARRVHLSKRSRNNVSRRHSRSEDGFNMKKCVTWFKEYTSLEEPELLGPEGMEKFCQDLCVDPEDIVMLVIAYKMGARQMGYFTQDEWLKGLMELQCDGIVKLQNKLDYLRGLLNEPNTFKAVFRYAYDFARDKDQRSVETSIVRELLALLLPRWALRDALCRFLERGHRYRVVNRDQWCNILEFSRTVDAHLTAYDAEGAWPVMLDEFVEWLRAEREGESMQTSNS